MRAFQFIIVFLLLLQVASAHEAYSCKPFNVISRVRLGKTVVNSENCVLTQHERYSEICTLGNKTLMVSKTPNLPSVLVLGNGNIHKVDCTTPEQRQQQQGQQQQQQQQQEQQEQDAGEGPGHGGNTVGGGHGKKGNE